MPESDSDDQLGQLPPRPTPIMPGRESQDRQSKVTTLTQTLNTNAQKNSNPFQRAVTDFHDSRRLAPERTTNLRDAGHRRDAALRNQQSAHKSNGTHPPPSDPLSASDISHSRLPEETSKSHATSVKEPGAQRIASRGQTSVGVRPTGNVREKKTKPPLPAEMQRFFTVMHKSGSDTGPPRPGMELKRLSSDEQRSFKELCEIQARRGISLSQYLRVPEHEAKKVSEYLKACTQLAKNSTIRETIVLSSDSDEAAPPSMGHKIPAMAASLQKPHAPIKVSPSAPSRKHNNPDRAPPLRNHNGPLEAPLLRKNMNPVGSSPQQKHNDSVGPALPQNHDVPVRLKSGLTPDEFSRLLFAEPPLKHEILQAIFAEVPYPSPVYTNDPHFMEILSRPSTGHHARASTRTDRSSVPRFSSAVELHRSGESKAPPSRTTGTSVVHAAPAEAAAILSRKYNTLISRGTDRSTMPGASAAAEIAPRPSCGALVSESTVAPTSKDTTGNKTLSDTTNEIKRPLHYDPQIQASKSGRSINDCSMPATPLDVRASSQRKSEALACASTDAQASKNTDVQANKGTDVRARKSTDVHAGQSPDMQVRKSTGRSTVHRRLPEAAACGARESDAPIGGNASRNIDPCLTSEIETCSSERFTAPDNNDIRSIVQETYPMAEIPPSRGLDALPREAGSPSKLRGAMVSQHVSVAAGSVTSDMSPPPPKHDQRKSPALLSSVEKPRVTFTSRNAADAPDHQADDHLSVTSAEQMHLNDRDTLSSCDHSVHEDDINERAVSEAVNDNLHIASQQHVSSVKSNLFRARRALADHVKTKNMHIVFSGSGDAAKVPHKRHGYMNGFVSDSLHRPSLSRDTKDTGGLLMTVEIPDGGTKKLKSMVSITQAAPASTWKNDTVRMPSYTQCTSVRNNVAAPNQKILHSYPYLGEEIEDSYYTTLRERYTMDVRDRDRKVRQRQQVLWLQRHAQRLLAHISCPPNVILYYLLAPADKLSEVQALERKASCKEDFDRDIPRWQQVFTKLTLPDPLELERAHWACSMFLAKAGVSLWHIVRKDAICRPDPDLEIDHGLAKKSDIDRIQQLACRVCHTHDCLYHMDLMEHKDSEIDTDSDIEQVEMLDIDWPREHNYKRRITLPQELDHLMDSDDEIVVGRRHSHDKTTYDQLLQQMTESMVHERMRYVPCHHPGRPCAEEYCKCARDGVMCEKACGCSQQCGRRFRGCKCHAHTSNKRTICNKDDRCACFRLRRECDPDLCKGCDAHVVLDPVNRDDGDLKGCQNVPMQLGYRKRVLLGRSAIHGFGLYAGESIKRGEFVGEYTGELTLPPERVRRGEIYDIQKLSYLFMLAIDQEVDSHHVGNKIRFINHAKETGKNGACNLEPIIKLCNMTPRIGVWANRDIEVGEELFFNYGDSYTSLLEHFGASNTASSSKKKNPSQQKGKTRTKKAVELEEYTEPQYEPVSIAPGSSKKIVPRLNDTTLSSPFQARQSRRSDAAPAAIDKKRTASKSAMGTAVKTAASTPLRSDSGMTTRRVSKRKRQASDTDEEYGGDDDAGDSDDELGDDDADEAVQKPALPVRRGRGRPPKVRRAG